MPTKCCWACSSLAMPPECGVSRKIERATVLKPSPSASSQATSILSMIRWPRIARTFLPELKELFVQVLLLAQETGVLKLGTISLDRRRGFRDASRHNAVSYKRLRELETQLQAEIEELFILSEQSDQREIPDGLVVREEMARREDRLARLAQATLVLETRATERAAAPSRRSMRPSWRSAQSGSARRGAAQVAAHRRRLFQDHARATSSSSPRHQSRSMKNPTDAGFEQDYNVQVAVDQKRLLIVGCALSHHPNDTQEAEPTLAAIPSEIGTPEAAAFEAGYFGPATLAACTKRCIEPSIATGRDPHHASWQQRFRRCPSAAQGRESPGQDGLQAASTAVGKRSMAHVHAPSNR